MSDNNMDVEKYAEKMQQLLSDFLEAGEQSGIGYGMFMQGALGAFLKLIWEGGGKDADKFMKTVVSTIEYATDGECAPVATKLPSVDPQTTEALISRIDDMIAQLEGRTGKDKLN